MNEKVKKALTYTWCIAVGLLAIGTFWDLQIVESISSHESWFYLLFAGIGELPIFVFSMAAGILLIRFIRKDKVGIAILQVLGGTVLISYGVFLTVVALSIHWSNVDTIVGVIAAVVLFTLLLVLVLKKAKTLDRSAVMKWVLLISILVFGALILNTAIRIPWGRLRYIYMDNPAVQFTPWYLPQGAGGEHYVSFPSGHTANATVMLGSVALSTILPKLKGKELAIYIISVVFAITVGFSRVAGGMHFISDIAGGFMVTLSIFHLAYGKIYKKSKSEIASASSS